VSTPTEKSFNLGLLFKTGQNEGHKNLQNSGPVRATVFRMGWNTWQGERRVLLVFVMGPGWGNGAQRVWRIFGGACPAVREKCCYGSLFGFDVAGEEAVVLRSTFVVTSDGTLMTGKIDRYANWRVGRGW
jgi:hypothetical protein